MPYAYFHENVLPSDNNEEAEDKGGHDNTITVINNMMICRDGFELSIQASAHHYCTPRDNRGPYTHVEVGFPNSAEERFLPFADDIGLFAGIPMIYVNVPAATINEILQEHGGMSQGKLPDMEEYDQDGYAWAAAAPMPSSIYGSPALNHI